MKPEEPKGLFPAQEYLIVNDNDPDLVPIKVPLPTPPPFYEIDNWNLPVRDQYFRHQKIPAKLLKIQKDFETLDEMWEHFEQRRKDLKDEIKWLKTQWHRRINGYWFYNAGEPTFITGQHYFYLNFYYLDVGRPDYRDRTRKRYIFLDYILNYKYDFKDKRYNDKGERMENLPEDELEDVGRRMFYGVIESKMRRAGVTNESLSWIINRGTCHTQRHSGIQSIDETHSRRAYQKLVSAFKKLPWFFNPEFERHTERNLKFLKTQPGVGKEVGLETRITYASTSSCYHYDGEALFDFLFDEIGKVVLENVYQGWSVIKNTLGRGSGAVIGGFALMPSTAGEFEKEGGENFFNLLKESNYYERNNNGQTRSGLVAFFMPAYEGLEGFIDKHGRSVVETPTPEQAKFIHRKIGAREFLLNEREHYLKLGTPEALKKYREQQRLYPLCLKECFVSDGESIGFNTIILEKRISELRFMEKITATGNFVWAEGKDSYVRWVDDPNGKWVVSKLLTDGRSNQRYYRDGMWWPTNKRFAMTCGDPFSFNETEGTRMSKGAILTVERWNSTLDPLSKSILDWETPRIICEYAYRESDTILFAEDCLLQSIYYGGMMNPESNNPLIREHFKRRGYGGYLHYMKNDQGQYNNTPGYHLKNQSDKLLGLIADFIERHGHKCNHINVLKQCLDLRGKKDITNKDLVAALGGVFLGIDDDYRPEIANSKGTDISWYFSGR
jgi:hypothetical protein